MTFLSLRLVKEPGSRFPMTRATPLQLQSRLVSASASRSVSLMLSAWLSASRLQILSG